MIENFVESFSKVMLDNPIAAPFIALLAGIITSFSPCSLSSVPLVIGYVGSGSETKTKKAFLLSVVFSLGTAITFTILGVVAATFGKLMGTSSSIWYILLGILMVLMSLQIWEIYEFIPSTYLTGKNKKRGYAGAFLTGILAGIFSSPCATPILIVVLSLVARKGNILWGGFLLFLYGVGHGTLVIISGTSMGFMQKLKSNNKYGVITNILKYILGFFVLCIGLYMFYLAF